MPHPGLSYVNIEHGGRTDAGYSDYRKVTGMFHGSDWPDRAVIGLTDHNTRDSCSDLRLSVTDMSATEPEAPRSVAPVRARWSK